MSNKENSTALSEHEEILLMKYFDGECGIFERFKARGLLRDKAAAARFLKSIDLVRDELSVDTRDSSEAATNNTTIWDKVSMRINQEERAELLLGRRRVVVNTERESLFSTRIFGLTGAVAVAAIAVLIFPLGNVEPPVESKTAALTASPSDMQSREAPEVKLVSSATERRTRRVPRIIEPNYPDAVEVDWLRSEGSVRMIRDRRDPSVIIWVKRKQRNIGLGQR